MINKKKCSVSGSNRNSLISALLKPADFEREMSPMPGSCNFHDAKEKPRRGECHTVKYRVRIIRFNEVPIKLKKNIYQQTIIVSLFVYTYLYTYVY